MNECIQEAKNLLAQLQETRSEMKSNMKIDNQHPIFEEMNAQIHSIRKLLTNWDNKKWDDIRFGRTL